MDLGKLKYFYAVAKHGGFTAAAREIQVSQPSISKMVQLLEQETKEKLLVRSRKGVELTPAGRAVFQSCEQIFGQLDDLKIQLQEIHRGVSGLLSLGASDNLCNYVLPNLLNDLVRNFPKIQIQLLSGASKEIQLEVQKNHAELGLFYTPVKAARGFDIEQLKFIEFVVVANSEVKLKDLERIPYVGSRDSDYRGKSPAAEMLKTLGLEPRTVLQTNNQETQKRMSQLGAGFTVIPLHMAQEELRAGKLFRVPTSTKIGSPLFLIQRKGRALSPAAEVFKKILRAELQER